MKLFEIRHTTRVKPMALIDVISHMKRECKNSLQQMNDIRPLWRGGSYKLPMGVGFGESTASTPRQSANTANYYTMWIDNSPLWKEFPKRSQSFIGSSSEFVAEGYGDVALMIPFDNAKIGVCPRNDFWVSFRLPEMENLNTLNSFCTRAIRILKGDPSYEVRSYAEMKKIFDATFDDLVDAAQEQINVDLTGLSAEDASYRKKLAFRATNFLETLINDGDSWLSPDESLADMMDRLLAPKNFKLMTGSSYEVQPEREVFIDGACIFLIPDNMSSADKFRFYTEFKQYSNFANTFKDHGR